MMMLTVWGAGSLCTCHCQCLWELEEADLHDITKW